MRSKSPELMSEIKKYIEDYYLQNRQSPSTTKIAEAVGIARGTAYKYLVEMCQPQKIPVPERGFPVLGHHHVCKRWNDPDIPFI